MKIYTCCPDAGCSAYRDTMQFLQSWGIEPNIGCDDDGHYFEIDEPDDAAFQEALALRSAVVPDVTGEFLKQLLKLKIPPHLNTFQVVDAFFRATCVAANIRFDQQWHKKMLLRLARKSKET